MITQYLRFPVVKSLTGLSRSTLWRLEQNCLFPKRRKLSKQSVGWNAAEVNEWMKSRTPVANKGGE